MQRRANKDYLVSRAYRDDTGLRARSALYDYQRPRIDLVAEVRTAVGDATGRTIVDVGCGDGRYLRALQLAGARVLGIDLSAGMLAPIVGTTTLVVGDAERLPLADGSADVVLQAHVLYHLPDPDRAVREAKRVLRVNGRLIVLTNGPSHLRELDELWRVVLTDAGVCATDDDDIALTNSRFGTDAARAMLTGYFPTIDERRLAATVVVNEPGPVIRHAASTTGAITAGSVVVDRLRSAVRDIIDRHGEFRITTEVGLLLATQ